MEIRKRERSKRNAARRTSYSIRKGRFYPIIAIVILLIVLMILLVINDFSLSGKYRLTDFDPEHLMMYFTVERDLDVSWAYLAAVDLAENLPREEISKGRSDSIALLLLGIAHENELPMLLNEYNDDKRFAKKVISELRRLETLQAIYAQKIFPIGAGYEYGYQDGFGARRTYGGERSHEGIDIMCSLDVPIVSVGDGRIEAVGWNEWGGWRIGIRGNDKIYYYYAHMTRYEGVPKKGDRVRKGQIIGYVGDSGYGQVGTTGRFAPHLHFGMYEGVRMSAVNPYPFLKAWEYNDR